MIKLKKFTYKHNDYICYKDAHLGFFKVANVVYEDGKIVFIDYISKSVSATIKKFKDIKRLKDS